MTEPTYRFLDYEMYVAARKLIRNNTDVLIRPKTFAVLSFLLANRNAILTKEEILENTWPDADVQDQAVFQSISELRSLFKGHNCIQTVRGRGYRWILSVKSANEPAARRSPVWPKMIAASLVVLAGSAGWWHLADDSRSFTVVVIPGEFTGGAAARSSITAPLLERMLAEQLGRMGWNTQATQNGVRTADRILIAIEAESLAMGTSLNFRLQDGLAELSGNVQSATPLGAIRDLATELHGMLSLIADQRPQKMPVSQLFDTAKRHLDRDAYALAEAYLTVALAEQPNQRTLQRALAYAYRQLGRQDEALGLATSMYQSASKDNARVDRMLSAIMLSQLHLQQGSIEEAEEFADEALNLATNMNDILIVAEAQEQLGEISLLRGNVPFGREQLTIALKYFSTFCPSGEFRVTRRLTNLES